MTRQSRSGASFPTSVDRSGRVLLVGGSVYLALAVALTTARLVGTIRHEHSYSATTWSISAATGLLFGLLATGGLLRAWRRRGGQRLVHLATRAVRSGELPTSLPLRIAVLRELQRRDEILERQLPPVVVGVSWTVLTVTRITTDHSAIDVAGTLLIWGAFAAYTVQGIIERKHRPRLKQLIARLREHPTAELSTSNATTAN